VSAAPRLTLVAAVARNGVIGDGQRLPWRLPEDMRHFRESTAGGTVLMGRRTWLSLPERFRPLPGRRNVVLTSDPAFAAPGAETTPSLADALARLHDAGEVFVLGGSRVFADALPLAQRLLLTEIGRDFEGEVHFPVWPREQFIEHSRRTIRAAPPNDFDFDFVDYRRVAA
jgi:dihydrofolate reductase